MSNQNIKKHAKTRPTSNMCTPEGKEPLTYRSEGNRSKANDAEAKIVEDIAAKLGLRMYGVKLRLSVSKRPCPSCQRAMCRTMECGLEIELCLPEDDKKGNTGQTPKCDENDTGSGTQKPGPMDSQLPESGW